MKKILSLLPLLCALPLSAVIVDEDEAEVLPPVETVLTANCHKVLDPLGCAGMVAAEMPMEYGGSQIIMAGGANFPGDKPAANVQGPKVFHDEVDVLSPTLGGVTRIGKLPYPVGYAACASTDKGMMIAGGCNAEGHLSKAIMVRYYRNKFKVKGLADLPIPVAYPAFTEMEGKLYVFGGQETADAVTALKRCFVFENNAWRELAPMPDDGRMLAAAGVVNGKIYVAGGCSLHPDAAGKAERTYLASVLVYDPATDSWSRTSDMPETIVGMATPLPTFAGKLYVVGGDPGNYYRATLAGNPPATHPGQNRAVYAFNPEGGFWSKEGDNTVGVATAPCVRIGNTIYTVSGELRPRVRTPLISAVRLNEEQDANGGEIHVPERPLH